MRAWPCSVVDVVLSLMEAVLFPNASQKAGSHIICHVRFVLLCRVKPCLLN